MSAVSNPTIAEAFSRHSKRVILFVAGFAIVAFGVGSEILLRIQAQRSVALRIGIFRAALALRDDADLAESVRRLQGTTVDLFGVATMDAGGGVSAVYPDIPELQAAVGLALRGPGGSFETASPAGKRTLVTSAIVDLPRAGTPTRVMLLVRRTPHRMVWAKAMLLVTGGVGVMAGLRLYTLNRWFERQIVRPLKEFSRLHVDPHSALQQMPSLEPGDLEETAQIARQFESLLRLLSDADERARKLEQENRRQMLHKEVGFDLKLKRARDEATMDVLTKLRNRAFLESELENIFARQVSRQAALSAVMLDVDNFKRYNDTHGHQVGDSLLRFIGSLLRGGLRPVDYAVRYGGDEFLLLLPDTSAREAAAITERLIKNFSEYAGELSKDCEVSMSAGVAGIPDAECDSGHILVARADAALYAAKYGGKNTVSLGGHPVMKRPPPNFPSDRVVTHSDR